MTQKALKLALDALEKAYHAMQTDMAQDQIEEAITAIKEALREHAMREVQRLGQEIEQEPVKYSDYEPDGVHHNKPPQRSEASGKPSAWVGLTDAEVEKVFFDMGQFAKIDLKTFARAIEAKLKDKNDVAQKTNS